MIRRLSLCESSPGLNAPLCQLSEDHELFEDPQIIYAKMDEFCRVCLLKDLNVRC